MIKTHKYDLHTFFTAIIAVREVFIILVKRYLNGVEASPEVLIIAAQKSTVFEEEVKRARQRIIKDANRALHGVSPSGASAAVEILNEK